jgi:hypothetical protein
MITEDERKEKSKFIQKILGDCMYQVSNKDPDKLDALLKSLQDNKPVYDLLMYFSGIMCEVHQKNIEDLLPKEVVSLYLQSVENPVGEFREKQ